MNKTTLISQLAEKTKLNDTTAKDIVNTVFDDMTQAFIKGERVEIRGFGSFKVRSYKGYTGRNPRSGESTEVKPKRLPVFKPSKELRKLVDYPKELSA